MYVIIEKRTTKCYFKLELLFSIILKKIIASLISKLKSIPLYNVLSMVLTTGKVFNLERICLQF